MGTYSDLFNQISARWPGPQLASTRQLERVGLDHRAVTAAVRRGILIRVRRGVYVRRDVWREITPWDRDRLTIEAHWIATNGNAIYSHVSAARLSGCATWDCGSAVHITVPYSVSRTSHSSDVIPHRLVLPEKDIAELWLGSGQRARVTSLNRTVADCARILEPEHAAVIGDHALRLGATIDGIRAAAEETGAVRGACRIERLLPLLDSRSESPGETRARLALLAAGIPEPVLQFEIPTAEGTFRADFAWPEVMVILEFDGEAKYFDYRPTDVALLDERRRESALIAEGWFVVRARWADLSVPGGIGARVAAAFDRAARRIG